MKNGFDFVDYCFGRPKKVFLSHQSYYSISGVNRCDVLYVNRQMKTKSYFVFLLVKRLMAANEAADINANLAAAQPWMSRLLRYKSIIFTIFFMIIIK